MNFDEYKNILIELNKQMNEDEDWWINKNMFESAFSSYYYYESEIEQICSVYRGLLKNHPFNNGNKRTASLFLCLILEQYDYEITNENLIKFTLKTCTNNYYIEEIALLLNSYLIPRKIK